jgi:fatty-acid desaturase
MERQVKEYLISDRQWFKAHRIAHAKWQRDSAHNDNTRSFWESVIEALEG